YTRFLPDILVPHVTLILDCPVATGLDRIRKGRTRLSTFEDMSTLERARQIYESRQGAHYVHIDASGAADDTFHQVCTELRRRFPELRPYLTECNSLEEMHRDMRTAIA